MKIFNYTISFLVKILVILDNPQITNARSDNYKPEIKEFFGLCMLVGISEAILRLKAILRLCFFSLRSNNNFFNSFVQGLKMQIIKQLRPIHNNTPKLNPWFVTGFTDGDGSFLINVRPKPNRVTGYGVELVFRVNLHSRDRALLENFRDFFGVGRLTAVSEKYSQYWVGALEDIRVIVKHFNNYPLITQKWSDFELFKKAVDLVERKEHLTPEGLEKILSIKAVLNNGLSEDLDFLDFKKIQLLKKNTYLSLTKESFAEITQIKSRMNKGRKTYKIVNVNNSLPGNKRSYSTTSNLANSGLCNSWLAGLIDGDGQFQTTKKGFSSLKIVMHINDKYPLYLIKHKYGGFIKEISGSNALKYKLTNPKGLIHLIRDVNGLIRNPIRMLQIQKICVLHNINLLEPLPLTYNNGWFSGFFDSDGSIHIDEKSAQLIFSVTQKNRYLLEPLQNMYGGRISILRSKEAFQYSIYRKKEILNLRDVYFKNFPLKSSKASRLNLIEEFYQLNHYSTLDVKNLDKFNKWIHFKNKWDKIV
jgi:hypothetical protein